MSTVAPPAGLPPRDANPPDTQTPGTRSAAIVCANLVRIFKTSKVEVVALQGLDLSVAPGEMVAVVGASGSGKSTLLNILSGLDTPSAGLATVGGQDLLKMSRRARVRYRRHTVGFLFQQARLNLLPYLSAADNIMMPMVFSGLRPRARARRASELLELVGMGHRAQATPQSLSGGEQQRVALAVALANHPSVLLADEPTGELDTENSDLVFHAMRNANQALGITELVVTHDSSVSSQVQRTVAIRDGRTSAEVHQRLRRDADGVERTVREEYAVLDRAGRLQLPHEYTRALDMNDLVRLDLESDHIGVWPTNKEQDDD